VNNSVFIVFMVQENKLMRHVLNNHNQLPNSLLTHLFLTQR